MFGIFLQLTSDGEKSRHVNVVSRRQLKCKTHRDALRKTDSLTSLHKNTTHPINSLTMVLQIQIASDLHIEFYKKTNIPEDIIVPNAPILALLGDIGLANTNQLQDFLFHQADRFEKVLFIPGNHEYYNNGTTFTVEQQLEWMKQVCSQRDNIYFMEEQVLELEGVTILATTLWTNIPPESQRKAERYMNDYDVIYMKNTYNGMLRRLNAEDTTKWHQESVDWLESEIERCRESGTPVLVLTHHTPLLSGTSDPNGSDLAKEIEYCAGSDLSRLLRDPVRAWCCGHTHYNFDFIVKDGTARLLSNQRGYDGELTEGYNNSFILKME